MFSGCHGMLAVACMDKKMRRGLAWSCCFLNVPWLLKESCASYRCHFNCPCYTHEFPMCSRDNQNGTSNRCRVIRSGWEKPQKLPFHFKGYQADCGCHFECPFYLQKVSVGQPRLSRGSRIMETLWMVQSVISLDSCGYTDSWLVNAEDRLCIPKPV